MIKCALVEDEMPAREELKYFINLYHEFLITKEFENPLDALKFLQSNQVDVIFLDINMPGMDGIVLAKILYKLNPQLKIIFITAYREYGVDAFEVKAFDYILKPYSEEKIRTVLENIIEENLISKDKIEDDFQFLGKLAVNDEDKMCIISIDDIFYIDISEKEISIHTKDKTYTIRTKISTLEEFLPSNKFYRTHRSYIVNLNKITGFEPWFNGSYVLSLESLNEKIPVSRTHVKTLKNLFLIK